MGISHEEANSFAFSADGKEILASHYYKKEDGKYVRKLGILDSNTGKQISEIVSDEGGQFSYMGDGNHLWSYFAYSGKRGISFWQR